MRPIAELLTRVQLTTLKNGPLQDVCTHMYKVKHKLCPAYIRNIFSTHSTSYSLRQTDFSIPRYGQHSLRYLGPKLWAKLPKNIRSIKTIRPLLEYCSPVFHHALPKYLCNDIEGVQKRAVSIIMPNNSYEASLVNFNLTTLQARREQQCFKLFDSISGDHKLSGLVPLPKNCNYNLRNKIKYLMPRFHTDRFRQSFIPAMCSRFLSS